MAGTVLVYLDVKCRSVVCVYYCVSPRFESLTEDRPSSLRFLVISSFYPGRHKVYIIKQALAATAFWFAADEKNSRLIANGHRSIWLELTECPHSSRMLRGLDWYLVTEVSRSLKMGLIGCSRTSVTAITYAAKHPRRAKSSTTHTRARTHAHTKTTTITTTTAVIDTAANVDYC